jgi:hypothetical protein
MRCDHAMAGIIKQQILQEVIGLLPRPRFMGPLCRQLLLDSLEQAPVHDRRLLSWQNLAFVPDLADEEPVAQNVREGAPAERDASASPSGRAERSCLGADVFGFEIADKLVGAGHFQISPKDQPDALGAS